MIDNVVNNYISYVTNVLYNYYEILLNKKYSKSLVKPFVNKYITVRYYNDTLYQREGDFVKRFSKELNSIAKELIKENKEKEELIKNICALFGYIFYFDECLPYDNLNDLCDTLLDDKLITLEYDEDTKNKLKTLIKDFNNKKEDYFKLFTSKDFEIKLKRLKTKVYKADIIEHVEISKLYSEYAINEAFNTGVIAEDKIYLLYILLSNMVLKNAIKLDFSINYLVNFPSTLIKKHKKTIKYLNALDNDLLKSHINMIISYSEYISNKQTINNYINMGFNFAILIDETYHDEIDNLILFSYVLVYDNLPSYDMIIECKDRIKATIVAL
jgi:hypothetical protein